MLTPTGSLNHEGSSKFVEHVPSNIRDRIKLAVCLDSLVNMQAPAELFLLQG